ncbi:MAG TPA: amino acid adenylation domain-containing protein [Bryobacteraceae bacterium]|nr:amino acid adenylation domain-containing protein [Bryobacteraceae bacterium]
MYIDTSGATPGQGSPQKKPLCFQWPSRNGGFGFSISWSRTRQLDAATRWSTILELPTDRPRSKERSCESAWESIVLPQDLSDRLRDFSRQEGVSLFALLLTAFQTLLHRYSGQDDIGIGSEVHGNTVSIRTDFRGEPRFRELLGRVEKIVEELEARRGIPSESVVGELPPDRINTCWPSFHVLFAFHSAGEGGKKPEIAAAKGAGTETEFDLVLSVEDGPGNLEGNLQFSTERFDRATARRMLGNYRTLLAGAVDQPDQQVSHLPVLDEAERRQLLVAWNDTKREYAPLCVHQLFEEQVERTPDAVALVCRKNQWTYRVLNARANQLASYLQTQGVGPDVLVGVCCTPSLELMVGILGVLKAGGAYVPLDPSYPTERLSFMLADAGVKLLLTEYHLTPQLPPGPLCFFLDRDWKQLADKPATNPACAAHADDLAYVLYTSGSTGKPKGAEILHRGLTNYLSWAVEAYAVAQGEGAPVNSSISFDATITSFFTPLLAGKRVVLLPERDWAEALGELLQSSSDFSLVKITPAHLEALSQLLPESAGAPRARAFVIGGEALFAKQLTSWQARAPHIRMINEYGPTETVVGCCVYEASPDDAWVGAVPIGRPIANTQLYVLDRYLQPAPLGVPGELYVGGAGVARGYRNRPELTAERFLDNPFGPGRLYRTGDLVRYLPDGKLVYLGRLDHQVKIRGFRVELGEIEAVLTQHPGVRETAVVLDEKNGRQRLVAYMVPGPSRPSISDVRTYLNGKLLDYMVPAVFVFLDAMPLTPNGKVDRGALPAVDPLSATREHALIEPRDDYERKLRDIWEELLEVDPIGVTDNYFELGGHSLLVARLGRRIEQEFGKRLSMAEMFQTPTIAGMGKLLREESLSTPEDCKVFHLQPLGSRTPFICLGAGPFFLPLANAVGADQPFYGLDLSPLQPNRLSVPYRLEEIAGHVKRAVRDFQPRGPYLLGGWCLFGVLMYEAARQMIEEGDEVGMLVMIDSPNRAYERSVTPLSRIHSRLQKLKFHVERIGHIRPSKIPAFLKQQIAIVREEARVRKDEKEVIRDAEIGSRRLDFDHAFQIAARNYVPSRYPGRVFILQTTARPSGNHWDLRNRWRHLIDRLEVLDIPAAHEEMFREPHVQLLAEQMRDHLDTGIRPLAAASAR